MNINKLNPYALRLHAGRGPGGAGAYGAGAGTGSGGGAAGAPAGTFLLDTFSSSSAQDLDGRTGEIGATWTYNDDAAAFTVEGGLLGVTAAAGAFYMVVTSMPWSSGVDTRHQGLTTPGLLANAGGVGAATLLRVTDAGISAQTATTVGNDFEIYSAHVDDSGITLAGYGVISAGGMLEDGGILVQYDAALETVSARQLQISDEILTGSFLRAARGPSGATCAVFDVELVEFEGDFYVVHLNSSGTSTWQERIRVYGEGLPWTVTSAAFSDVIFTGGRVFVMYRTVEDDAGDLTYRFTIAALSPDTGAIVDRLCLNMGTSATPDVLQGRFAVDGSGSLYAILTGRDSDDNPAATRVFKLSAASLSIAWTAAVSHPTLAADIDAFRPAADGGVVVFGGTPVSGRSAAFVALNASTGGLAWQSEVTPTDTNQMLEMPAIALGTTEMRVSGYMMDLTSFDSVSVSGLLPADGSTGNFGTAFALTGASYVSGVSSASYTVDESEDGSFSGTYVTVASASSSLDVSTETASVFPIS